MPFASLKWFIRNYYIFFFSTRGQVTLRSYQDYFHYVVEENKEHMKEIKFEIV